ncbi:GNAT family N-acetyltransferase [Alkalitalea saponilacus]|uniref:GNAT family N-acetyltransferase n=1 Tax=Alkalitalea saponilacus TaxID=889453 RepID=UPI003743A479
MFHEFAEFEKLPDKMVNSVEQMEAESDFINGFVVLNETKTIIGYVTYFFAYYTWIGKSMYMDDLYVKRDFRGSGIGTKLIKKVIEKAKSDKCNKLRWQVSEWNQPAIDFYKNLGATVDSVESNCDLSLS